MIKHLEYHESQLIINCSLKINWINTTNGELSQEKQELSTESVSIKGQNICFQKYLWFITKSFGTQSRDIIIMTSTLIYSTLNVK